MREFFTDGAGQLSMSRLLMFCAFPFGAYAVIANPTAEVLGVFLGAFALQYVGGKASDAFNRRGRDAE